MHLLRPSEVRPKPAVKIYVPRQTKGVLHWSFGIGPCQVLDVKRINDWRLGCSGAVLWAMFLLSFGQVSLVWSGILSYSFL